MKPIFAARTTFFQPFTGQLNLALYVDCGVLTVHVIQGRHFWFATTEDASNFQSYVKLSLMPDTLMKSFSKTRSVYGRDSPHFSEKFSFELQSRDLSKRLLLSAWQFDGRRSHLLGCTSFGLRRLVSMGRVVSGWFYLLTAEVGKAKHLRAREDVRNDQENEGLPHLLQMEQHKLLMQRGDTGFGFSILGSNPVSVSKVTPDSDAAKVGLKVEDILHRVNGEDVTTSSSEAVARIIRLIGDVMLLDIYRPTTLSPEELLERQEVSPWRPRKRVHHITRMREPVVPAVLPSVMRAEAEPKRKRQKRAAAEPKSYDNAAFQDFPAPTGILRRDYVSKGNRVSFADAVTCQSILKVEDLTTDHSLDRD